MPYTEQVNRKRPMRSLTSTVRSRIRAILAAKGPMTCSDLVRTMGMDPKRHKGTIHAVMVDLEKEDILGATMKGKRRDLWFVQTGQIRKRDRIRAVIMGV